MGNVLHSINQIIVDSSGQGDGADGKNQVAAILSLDSNFSLYSVITDTDSEYDVRLRFKDSNIFLRVYTLSSHSRLAFAIETLVNDAWITLSSASGYYNNDVGPFAVTVSKIGDFLGTISIIPKYTYQGYFRGIRLRYGVANSTLLNNSQIFFYICESCNVSESISFNTFSTQYSLLSSASVNALVYGTDAIKSVKPVNVSEGYADILTASDAPNLLVPLYVYAYGTGFYTGELKWGGLYHMYALFNCDGIVSVTPNYKYNLMDTEILPGFTNLYLARSN